MFDLIVKNCKIVEHDGITEGNLLVRNGKIVGVSALHSDEKAVKVMVEEGRVADNRAD